LWGIRLHQKGDKRRTIERHYAAQATGEHVDGTGISSGPLFRPRLMRNSLYPPDHQFELVSRMIERNFDQSKRMCHRLRMTWRDPWQR
jgi:hypothetical protein